MFNYFYLDDHKLGSEHNFGFAWLSAELSAFLNCDLTLIYLLRLGGRRRRRGVDAKNMPIFIDNFGCRWRIYCLSSYLKYSKKKLNRSSGTWRAGGAGGQAGGLLG
jgi:hypothetical protein